MKSKKEDKSANNAADGVAAPIKLNGGNQGVSQDSMKSLGRNLARARNQDSGYLKGKNK